MSKCIIFLAIPFFLLSCRNKNNTPSGLLKQDKLQAVLWDVIRADALTTEYTKPDTSKNAAEENAKLQEEIFVIHGVSRENFYSSLDYYKKRPGQMKAILDSMINKADRERNTYIYPKLETGLQK